MYSFKVVEGINSSIAQLNKIIHNTSLPFEERNAAYQQRRHLQEQMLNQVQVVQEVNEEQNPSKAVLIIYGLYNAAEGLSATVLSTASVSIYLLFATTSNMANTVSELLEGIPPDVNPFENFGQSGNLLNFFFTFISGINPQLEYGKKQWKEITEYLWDTSRKRYKNAYYHFLRGEK